MIKYLLKYDLKKPLKLLKIYYIISVSVAIIARLLSLGNDLQIFRILSSIFNGLTITAVANVIINSFIQILVRFYTNFYKDQSYLTHTLPVEKESLLLSKYLSSLIIILLATVVSLISLFIVYYSKEFLETINIFLSSSFSELNISTGLFVFLLILTLFSQICTYLSIAFLCYVKGNYYNVKRGLKGFICFIVCCLIYTFSAIILELLVFLITGGLSELFSSNFTQTTFLPLIIVSLTVNIAYSFIFYFISLKEFKKGVNVD